MYAGKNESDWNKRNSSQHDSYKTTLVSAATLIKLFIFIFKRHQVQLDFKVRSRLENSILKAGWWNFSFQVQKKTPNSTYFNGFINPKAKHWKPSAWAKYFGLWSFPGSLEIKQQLSRT